MPASRLSVVLPTFSRVASLFGHAAPRSAGGIAVAVPGVAGITGTGRRECASSLGPETPRTVDVSIIIPCYNQASYLPQAIRSVQAWSRSVEIIVVDDGSTDATSEVAAACTGVDSVVRQANHGLAAARNAGLARARGRYVVFLDADDQLLPGALEFGAAALDERSHCAMVFGRCVMMGRDGRHWPTPEVPRIDRDHHAAMLRRNVIWMPAAAIFRREVLIELGGFACGFDAAADYDLYLRLTRRWPVHDHARVVAAYRRHDANMSGDASRMLRETLTVMRRHVPENAAWQSAWRSGRDMWREFYGTRLVEEISAHVRAREMGRALRKALTLAYWHPAGLIREAVKKTRLTLAARFPLPRSARPGGAR